MIPTAADIEIIERVPSEGYSPDATGGQSIVAPNEVWINGQPVLCTDDPIQIGPLSQTSAVTVTLTVFARSIRIGAAPVDQVAATADAYLQGVTDSTDPAATPETVEMPSTVFGAAGRIQGIAPPSQ